MLSHAFFVSDVFSLLCFCFLSLCFVLFLCFCVVCMSLFVVLCVVSDKVPNIGRVGVIIVLAVLFSGLVTIFFCHHACFSNPCILLISTSFDFIISYMVLLYAVLFLFVLFYFYVALYLFCFLHVCHFVCIDPVFIVINVSSASCTKDICIRRNRKSSFW